MAEILEAVLALWRHGLWNSRARLQGLLDRLRGRVARNAAAARAHARRRLMEQPP